MRYTYDDDDDAFASDATSTRRSTRHQSTRSSPFEAGPTYTASGRQIKQPRQGDYGESLLSNNVMSTDELAPDNGDESDPVRSGGRATRAGGRPSANGANNPRKRKHIDGYNSIDEMSDEDDADQSGDEWDSDRNDNQDETMPDADDEDSEPSDSDDDDLDQPTTGSLIVKLKVPSSAFSTAKDDTPPTSPPSLTEDESKADSKPSTDHPIVRIPPPDCAPDDETKPGAHELETSPSLTNGTTKIEKSTSPEYSEPQVVIKTGHPLQNVQYPAASPSKADEFTNGARDTMMQEA